MPEVERVIKKPIAILEIKKNFLLKFFIATTMKT